MFSIVLDGIDIQVSAHSVFLALGVGAGWAVAVFEARRRLGFGDGGLASGGRSREVALHALDAGLVTGMGGLIGGRALIVALWWSHFSARPMEIVSLSRGGLAWSGALVGGSFALALYAVSRGVSLRKLADILAPGVALGQAVGWLGCGVSGCGYGLASAGSWARELLDVHGILGLRHPAQAYMAAWSALVFMLLMLWPRPRAVSGGVALLYLLLTSLGYFTLEFARGDETLYVGSLRYSQWVGASLALLAVLGLFHLKREARPARGALR